MIKGRRGRWPPLGPRTDFTLQTRERTGWGDLCASVRAVKLG